MNLTQINSRLEEIDQILQDNSKRRVEVEPWSNLWKQNWKTTKRR